MLDNHIDILMITYNRPEYTRIALERLLHTCDAEMRVWVWHNGDHKETVEVVKSFQDHPSFYKFHHSIENVRLTIPTNWLWSSSEAEFISKVDDDCLMDPAWANTLRSALKQNPEFGIVGCWRFADEDFKPEIAEKKIQTFNGGHQLLRNCWVEGSGYLMKREIIEKHGLLKDGQSFPQYCNFLATKGYINGWYYPFLFQDHFDDPRSPYTNLKSNDDLEMWLPLTAAKNGVRTVDEWTKLIRRDAIRCQTAPYDPKYITGWRMIPYKIKSRLKKLLLNDKKLW